MENNGFFVDESVAENISDKKETFSFKQEVFDWLEVIITAIITVVILFSLFFRIATIDGPSMENTLFTNDKVVITNLFYKPKRGDIVVISRNVDNSVEAEARSDKPIIKRIIALEGETVDIDFSTGEVSVDGKKLNEPYTKTPTNRKYDIDFPVVVPNGCVFVLGDNRNESFDSRARQIGKDGMINEKYILGHAVLKVFPFNKIGGLE